MNWLPVNSPAGLQSYALIDDEDFERLHRHRWGVKTQRHGGRIWVYPCTYDRLTLEQIYLHRAVMGAVKGQIVDHIDGNTFDARKQNLRICTTAENTRNRIKPAGRTKNKYKGVTKDGNYFYAKIGLNNKVINLGKFEIEEFAALAYDLGAFKYHGAFARPNFPSEVQRFLLSLVDFYVSPTFTDLVEAEASAAKKNFMVDCNPYKEETRAPSGK